MHHGNGHPRPHWNHHHTRSPLVLRSRGRLVEDEPRMVCLRRHQLYAVRVRKEHVRRPGVRPRLGDLAGRVLREVLQTCGDEVPLSGSKEELPRSGRGVGVDPRPGGEPGCPQDLRGQPALLDRGGDDDVGVVLDRWHEVVLWELGQLALPKCSSRDARGHGHPKYRGCGEGGQRGGRLGRAYHLDRGRCHLVWRLLGVLYSCEWEERPLFGLHRCLRWYLHLSGRSRRDRQCERSC
mmetsp:Transcript_60871/g.170624  ORF Transcript_60871/g.170624 Transcript_60871/m.170624 type:complete len:237 (+) Transcript_60871:166-876(+)